MNRNWIWGLGLAALLLAVVFSVPRNATDNRLDQRMTPGAPTPTGLETNDPRALDNSPAQRPQAVNMSARVSNRVVDAARSVEGVDQAWAAVQGTTAIVGLTVDSSVKKEATADIEKAVAEQVEELPEIMEVGVTTDPNLVRQIREIDQDATPATPLNQPDRRLQSLIDRLIPQAKR